MKMITDFTPAAFMASVDKAIALEGDDFRQNRCVYRSGGKPYCIIGHVLTDLGAILDGSHEGQTADWVMTKLGYTSSKLIAAARHGQGLADNGYPWGFVRGHMQRVLDGEPNLL